MKRCLTHRLSPRDIATLRPRFRERYWRHHFLLSTIERSENWSVRVACPFFFPIAKLDDGSWLHPFRLPLGGGWQGQCCAPGQDDCEPTREELREFCNMGYARACPRLPKERTADAVRFSVTRDVGAQLLLCFVCELDHRPAGHGTLEYDRSLNRWAGTHPDPQIQRMAECYLETYLSRKRKVSPENDIARTDA